MMTLNSGHDVSEQSLFLQLKYGIFPKMILGKASVMRVSIPLDLSSRFFIPLPRFIRSLRHTPLLTPFRALPKRHMMNVSLLS